MCVFLSCCNARAYIFVQAELYPSGQVNTGGQSRPSTGNDPVEEPASGSELAAQQLHRYIGAHTRI